MKRSADKHELRDNLQFKTKFTKTCCCVDIIPQLIMILARSGAATIEGTTLFSCNEDLPSSDLWVASASIR